MKIKRILSTALTLAIVFTALVAVFPIGASAAYSEMSNSNLDGISTGYPEPSFTEEEFQTYLSEYLAYDYSSAYEMLSDELVKGYLYSVNSAGSKYSLYINKFTGFVYYVNNVTGQILTSNPINPGYKTYDGAFAVFSEKREELMSQIQVEFFETANPANTYSYNSYRWAASRTQITVTPISGGVRINYTLGDTTARYLLPGRITSENFIENIIKPIYQTYKELLEEYCTESAAPHGFDFFESDYYRATDEYGGFNTSTGTSTKRRGLRQYLTDTTKAFETASPEGQARLEQVKTDFTKLIGAYGLKNPNEYIGREGFEDQLDTMYESFPITKEGIQIFIYSGAELDSSKDGYAKLIKTYCPDYTFDMMYEDEEFCGYVDNSQPKPVVRCAIEYSFAGDGSLSVRVPASSITFDETRYTLNSITPLKYFGTADMDNGGYIFYPDGSGAILEFEDFYNAENNKVIAAVLSSSVYGKDYCYSKLTGAHREQITMPVYGVVNNVTASALTNTLYGKDTVTNGFFAIMEEGSALANLGFETGGASHKFGGAFASYNPYPSDTYDLSDTISVGSGSYTIVSDSKYSGSYVTRYVMLTDSDVGNAAYGQGSFYSSNYVGMATYYREYLKDNGVLSAINLVSEDLPLYVETLGSMEKIDKILTFPVTVDIPLTTFDDVATMYKELSQCEEYVKLKADEYQKLADEAKDDSQKYQYSKKAEEFRNLIGKVENIKNVNFKLTGFANGGMYYTYPAKVKWEKACGGKSGLADLIAFSATESTKDNINFSVYPEFDFMYIYNTASFDGISYGDTVARMVDNRYASKQEYNTVTQEYESFFTMVISSDVLDTLYSKFESKYSKYNVNTISVSTLGSDISSNFDKNNPINRDDSVEYVSNLLERMSKTDGYEIMTNAGNIYAIEYATHVLNAATDSSHFRYSSYAVPFTGIVLHSYVNYAGTPINYSGSPDYDILRSIENGASLYYILCYQNTAYMKDDKILNKYYGVDYINWYSDMLTTYNKLNTAIGDLQSYEIVDHAIILSERVIEQREVEANYKTLQDEIVEMLDVQIAKAVDAAFDALRAEGNNSEKRVKVVVDRAALITQFAGILNREESELDTGDFKAAIDAVIAAYQAEYPGDDANGNSYVVNFSSITYESKYSYITDSFAEDKDYVYTDYTSDNGNVTLVTYRKGDSIVRFILNYNIYSVTVKLDAEHTYTIESHGFVRIG